LAHPVDVLQYIASYKFINSTFVVFCALDRFTKAIASGKARNFRLGL